jgi:hypothetical protein
VGDRCLRPLSRGSMRLLLATALFAGAHGPAQAHGGGLNAEGCHNDRKGGTGYHCHRGSGGAKASRSTAKPLGLSSAGGSGSFANCSAARAAGAAPVRRGDPGYSSKLDRDGDGVGCER